MTHFNIFAILILNIAFKTNGLAGFVNKGGFDYYISANLSSQSESRQACRRLGAVFTSINSDEENRFLASNNTSYWTGLYATNPCSGDSCTEVLSQKCIQCRTSWRWYDASEYSYQNWEIYNPDDKALCVVMSTAQQWADRKCNSVYRYICKRAEIKECESGPCMNGGTCVDLPDRYLCVCSDGFTGNHCETDINECEGADKYCVHGNCKNSIGGYTCECVDGFRGKTCEYKLENTKPMMTHCYVTGYQAALAVTSSFLVMFFIAFVVTLHKLRRLSSAIQENGKSVQTDLVKASTPDTHPGYPSTPQSTSTDEASNDVYIPGYLSAVSHNDSENAYCYASTHY